MATVPGFLTKTYEIFNSPEYADCCGWGANGETIIIRKIEQFSKTVLPKYFKHSNFQSFVRQLNMYDFHKTVQDPSNGEFVHQYFKQNRPDLLQFIKRKANNRGSEQSKRYSGKQAGASAAAAASHNAAASSVMDFPMQQIQDLETLDSLDMSGAGEVLSGAGFESTSELAHRLNKVEEENRMLKKMFMDSHQKNLLMQDRMEKVLKTIYGVFVGQPGAGKTLSGRLPSLLLENIPSFAPPPRGLLMDEPHIASTSPQITELAADAELGPTVFRGTSFDAAAAAVAGLAPSSGGELRYLPSFDAMVMAAPLSGEPLVRSHAIASEDGDFMSDRVTQLPDENSFHSAAIPISAEGFAARAPSPQSSTFASSLSSAKPFHSLGLLPQSSAPSGAEEADPSWTAAAASKRRSLSVAPEDADMGKDWESSLPSKKPRPHTTDMPPPNASSSTEDTLQNVDLAQADTRQFIDLLNRNQSTTLNRLDSLEQTIATLMETMDYEVADSVGTARSTATGQAGDVAQSAVGNLPSS